MLLHDYIYLLFVDLRLVLSQTVIYFYIAADVLCIIKVKFKIRLSDFLHFCLSLLTHTLIVMIVDQIVYFICYIQSRFIVTVLVS